MYKLCAIDLDDTLLGKDHSLSERNRQAVRKVMALGIHVMIATGRMYASALPTAKALDLDTPIVCYNGAMVKHARTGEVWYEECVGAALAEEVMDYCQTNGLQLNFYYEDVLLSETYTSWLELYHKRTGSPVELRADFYTALRGVAPTKLIIVDDPEVIDRLLPYFRERFAGSLYVTKSNAEYLEFLPLNANKGSALAYVATRYGVSAEEVVAFGDSWNDLPMLQWAGLGVAVGNAKPEVREVAKKIVPSNEENGVAVGLEEIFALR